MSGARGKWVWVFGEIAGLRWVAEHKVMAFPEGASSRIAPMGKGDRAVLYVTRGAFGNPTRDEARLAGLATVLGAPQSSKVTISGRDFARIVPIRIDTLLPERTGPPVKPLAARLEFVKRPPVWGQYFRSSPILITADDFAVLADAVGSFEEG